MPCSMLGGCGAHLGAALGLEAMQSFAGASLRRSGPLANALERPKHCMLESSALAPSLCDVRQACYDALLARSDSTCTEKCKGCKGQF